MTIFSARTIAVVCALAFGSLASSAESACTYSVGEDAVKVEWTAFKLTEKLGQLVCPI